MQRYSNSAYWANSYTKAAQGLWPHEHEIPQGTVLYRFIDLNNAPSVIGADGPWWFELEHYQTIKSFAERHGYPLGYSARLFAAIFYEWSAVNAVVRAEVINGPLKVWKGKGKQVGKPPREDIKALAVKAWGDPNRQLSTRELLRFGKDGSKWLDLRTLGWRDHKTGRSGGFSELYKLVNGTLPRDVSVEHGFLTLSQPEISRKMTPLQGPLEVLQLFIPGLGRPHQKFGALMKFLDSQQIPTA